MVSHVMLSLRICRGFSDVLLTWWNLEVLDIIAKKDAFNMMCDGFTRYVKLTYMLGCSDVVLTCGTRKC